MDRSSRQAMLAEVWNAEGVEALLRLMVGTPRVRNHGLITELHEQSIECESTAPEVSTQLHRTAGHLAELHAGLRAAERIDDLDGLMRWQIEAPWRMSQSMLELTAAFATQTDHHHLWPWDLVRLPNLQAELDRLLATVRELAALPVDQRHERLQADPSLVPPALIPWLEARSVRSDAEGPQYESLLGQVRSWDRMQSPPAEQISGQRLEEEVLAELMELWHRLDPELDRFCGALGAEVVTGQRSLAEALLAIGTECDDPEQEVHRQTYLLHHLLDEPQVSVRRAALVAYSRLVMSPDAQAFARAARARMVQRWGSALELHWRVLPDPAVSIDAALRVIDMTLPSVHDLNAPLLARSLMFTRARLLRCLASWREGKLEEVLRAYQMAIDAPVELEEPIVRGRALAELAAVRRGRQESYEVVQDKEIRELYEQALELLRGTVVARARVLSDYAVYLGRPLRVAPEDSTLALTLAQQAVDLLAGLPDAVREHPLVRGDEALHRVSLANLRLEVGTQRPGERREAAVADYQRALARLGEGEELLAGLVHLNLACVALSLAPRGHRAEQIERARDELAQAVKGLASLPIPHARAVSELAMLDVRAAPGDSKTGERSIVAVEEALQRLPVGSEQVVRGRVQRQLGELYMMRDGSGDLDRAADHFATARTAFVRGGAARLAVEAARDYAETQLRQYKKSNDPSVLTRGAVVLEQATLVAERRWAVRRDSEPRYELSAMLDGVYGDLAWFQACLARPASQLLRTVTRAKQHRATPSLRALLARAERSSMLSPAYFDPFARRLPPPPPVVERRQSRGPSEAKLKARVESFGAADPEVLALDLTLTRWGTVVVAADDKGVRYASLALSREIVRRWIWGQKAAPGWWSCYLGFREAQSEDPSAVPAREQAWRAAGTVLAREMGRRLLGPLCEALGLSLEGRVVIIAAGRLSGLPLAAARLGDKALVGAVKGLAQIASLAGLPSGAMPAPRPSRALCVLAEPQPSPDPPGKEPPTTVGELRDVVRLLASARADVEVLAQRGEARGAAVYRPTQAKTRERATVLDEPPSLDTVLGLLSNVDHLFYGGQGEAKGLVLTDEAGDPVPIDASALASGSRFSPGASVFISAATVNPPSSEDGDRWAQLHALAEAGAGFIITAGCTMPHDMARDFTRGFYLYWALGRSIPVAYCAALGNLAGVDPSRAGTLMVWLGPAEGSGTRSTPSQKSDASRQ